MLKKSALLAEDGFPNLQVRLLKALLLIARVQPAQESSSMFGESERTVQKRQRKWFSYCIHGDYSTPMSKEFDE